MTPLEQKIAELAVAQGWEDETVGMLAYGFIVHSTSPLIQVQFLDYCQETATFENSLELMEGD